MNGKLPKIIEAAKVLQNWKSSEKRPKKLQNFSKKKTLKCLKRREIFKKLKVPEKELFQI